MGLEKVAGKNEGAQYSWWAAMARWNREGA
jgi:hypothetical protein